MRFAKVLLPQEQKYCSGQRILKTDYQLSALKKLPQVCVIDLDFYDKEIIQQLLEIRTKYPSIKLIAHSDIDTEKIVKAILKIGFESYLLVGSDRSDFKKAIEKVCNG